MNLKPKIPKLLRQENLKKIEKFV